MSNLHRVLKVRIILWMLLMVVSMGSVVSAYAQRESRTINDGWKF